MLKYGGLLVGNSSSGLIEGSYFNIPVVNIGIRQKYREHGKNVMNVNGTTNSIYDAIMKAIKRKKLTNEFIYGDGTSSRKIVKYMERINLGTDLIQKHLYY
jgi:UDP-N-acetylglucosamine 2-epimerase